MPKLYKHQQEMLSFSLSKFHCCFLADMGLGKTRPAVLSYYYRKLAGKVKNCLVVCPKAVMVNWTREIDNVGHELTYSIIHGSYKKRTEALENNTDFHIINYDYIHKLQVQLVGSYDMVIFDELTKVKHHSTNRAKAARYISKDIMYRLGLTGSPITNSPMDAYGEFLIIDPKLFGTNYFVFRNKYFKNIGKYFPLWIPKDDMLNDLAYRIGIVSIRIDKNKCLDLPETVYEVREIEMDADMRKKYISMRDKLIVELESTGTVATANVVLTKLIRLQQITSGFIKDEQGSIVALGSPKFDELVDLLEGELAGQKVIVWCRFTYSIDMIAQRFKHLCPAIIDGRTKHAHEQEDKFRYDDDCKLFIGQVGIGYGYNLNVSSIMVFYESDFSVEHRDQSEGRNEGLRQLNDDGSAKSLTVIDLAVCKSIDDYIIKSVEHKEDIAKYIYEILDTHRVKIKI